MSSIEATGKPSEQLRQADSKHPARGNEPTLGHQVSVAGHTTDSLSNEAAARVDQPRHRVYIDPARLEELGYIVPRGPRTPLMDQFRSIKRPLLARVRSTDPTKSGGRNKLIMITSALPGEGKTFIAINLALSLAMEVDQQVLLVDADTTQMSVAKRLGINPRPGLLDLLTDRNLKLSDVELSTNVDRLSFLPAGTANPHATELFSSQAMQQLLDTLQRQHNGVVVFDSAPLLPAVESKVLAPLMGQIVLVVHAGETGQAIVAQALDMLESCPAVATILNQATALSEASSYGYYSY